jgi:hypothetical protein
MGHLELGGGSEPSREHKGLVLGCQVVVDVRSDM